MKPVYQTQFGKPNGNCFEAALASILELDLIRIPYFGNGENWYDRFTTYMVNEHNLQPVDIKANNGFQPLGYHLIHGKSPRGDFDHSLVGLGGSPVHDPHPSGNCELVTVKAYTVFVSLMKGLTE